MTAEMPVERSDPMQDIAQNLLREVLREGEVVDATVRGVEVAGGPSRWVTVTNIRVIVIYPPKRVTFITFADLRRVQLDVEQRAPAFLALMPDALAEAHVFSIPHDEYDAVYRVVAAIGRGLASLRGRLPEGAS